MTLAGAIARDLSHAIRRLGATPAFTVFAVITLALGIGVTTGMYAAVRAVLSPPSGLGDTSRLVTVSRSDGGSLPAMSLAWPEYQDFMSRQTAFDGVAAWSFVRNAYTANGHAETGFAECVSGTYFHALGVDAAAGRLLQPADDRPGAPPAAVISHATWRRLFDTSAEAIGQPIKLNGVTFTIVGIASPSFTGLFNGGLIATGVWIPMNAARLLPSAGLGIGFDPGDRGRHWILLTAHLAPGHTVEDAKAEVVGIGRTLDAAAAESSGRPQTRPLPPWSVRPIADVPKIMGAGQVVGPMSAALMLAVGLVLLVACTNLANLMLARSASRRHDAAVRLSLGASRAQLVRESLAESVILAAAGCALGLGVARLLIGVIATPLVITQGVAVALQPSLDLAVFLTSIAATLLALVTAGLGPAWHAFGTDIRAVIAPAGQGTTSSRWRGRRYLIALQVSVSVLLIAIAGLCVAQVQRQAQADVGMDAAYLALAEVNFTQQRIDQARARQIADDVMRQVAQQPGVVAVSVSSGLPEGISTPGAIVRGPGGTLPSEYVAATPDVLRALGIRLLRGRGIDAHDAAGTAPIIVLGEQTAIALFGSVDVIGRDVAIRRRQWVNEPATAEETRTVVGIVTEPPFGARRQGVAYLPLAQHFEGDLVFAARTAGDPASLVLTLQQAVRTVAPDAAVSQALTGEALMAQGTLFFRVVGAIASVLGTMAIVVALAGLYGILSFLVAGRVREIGIRMAIGASAPVIRRQILREGLRPVWMGLVVGIAAGALARQAMRPMFLRLVPAVDVSILLLVPVLFVAAGIIACYLPARRASRVEPVVALRRL
jgi:predicted permease